MDNKIKSKELSQKRGASETGKPVGELGGKEVGVSKSRVRRSSIDWAIEELIDKRSLIGKWIGEGVPREKLLAHLDNINAIEEFFKEAGTKIPEDILKIFDRIGYITEAQAVELKKLAQQAIEAERPKKVLETEERTIIDYGPFRSKDMVDYVMKFPGAIGLSSVSKSFRKLLGDPKEKLRVKLTTEDLKVEGSEKIKFALKNDLMVSINYVFDNQEKRSGDPQSLFTPQESYNQFISCIRKNPKLFNKIEVLNLDNLIVTSEMKFQELLDSCESLKFLRIMSIADKEELNFPKLLTFFSCVWWIEPYCVLQFSEKLVSFECSGIGFGTVLCFSENLKSFSNNEMTRPIFKYPENTPLVSVNIQFGKLELPEGLNFLTMDSDLKETITLPEKLEFLSCDYIRGNFNLVTSKGSPVNLKTRHCQRVYIGSQGGDIVLPDSLEEFICGSKEYSTTGSIERCFMWLPSKLLKFSSGNINAGVVLSFPAGLLSLSIGDVAGDDTFDFPDGIPQLEVLEYGKVEGEHNSLMIQKLKENMKKPE